MSTYKSMTTRAPFTRMAAWVREPCNHARACVRAPRKLPGHLLPGKLPALQTPSWHSCSSRRAQGHAALGPGGEGAPDGAASGQQREQEQQEPWQLMGRVVQEQAIDLGKEAEATLIRSAAQLKTMQLGISEAEFESRLGQLLTLLPGLSDRLLSLKTDLLLQLCSEPDAVASRLITLKSLYPAANLNQMIYKRPEMLTAAGWAGVEAGSAKLRETFGEGPHLDALVQAQPLLLVPQVDTLLSEITRLVPGSCPKAVLLSNPSIVPSLMSNRGLSLW
ncbi:hypothetical protein FOA52_008863 [Chlamydomonas sp. UWO 241]|nr:hypothetical protein FOA52_008863 [Chlamydomonas sp. UWO 241]